MTFEKSFAIKETEVVQAGYLNLGWDNGRMQNTIEQANCYSLGHNKLGEGKMFDVQGNFRGSKNIHGCNVCKWFSYYDCSD